MPGSRFTLVLGVLVALSRSTAAALVAVCLSGTLAHALPARAAIDPPVESAIGGEALTFKTDDGVQLVGYLFRPPKGEAVRGAIVWAHEPFRSGRDWAYMAEKMSRHGFVSLIFDLRGHGESLKKGDVVLDREVFGPEDYAAMTGDMKAAITLVRSKAGADVKVHLAGADLGSSLALMAAIEDSKIHSVAMLSPGLGYDGVNLFGKAPSYGERPVMLVFSSEDGYSRKSVEVLSKDFRGPQHVETYYGAGHGSKMLAREARLEGLLISWFLGTVITPEGRALADTGKPQSGDKAAEAVPVDAEAERKKLEAQKKAAEAAKKGAVGGDEAGKKIELE